MDLFTFEDAPEEIVVPDHGDHLVLWKRIPKRCAVWTHESRIEQLDVEAAELVLVGPGHAAAVAATSVADHPAVVGA